MGDVKVRGKLFFGRLNELYSAWKAGEEGWGSKSAFCILHDSQVDDVGTRPGYIQIWLLGWEFPDTVMLGTQNNFYFVTSSTKAKILKPLVDEQSGREIPSGEPKVHILVRPPRKSEEDDTANVRAVLEHVKEQLPDGIDKPLLGVIPQDNLVGKLADTWSRELESSGIEVEDVTLAFAWSMAVKDSKAQDHVRTAGSISSIVLRKHLLPRIEQESKTKHSEIAEEIDALFANPEKISPKLQAGTVDRCYTPIIQSGGEVRRFFLLLGAGCGSSPTMCIAHYTQMLNVSSKPLRYLVNAIGAQYKSYASNVARTYFINPTKSHEVAYSLLLKVREATIAALVPGKEVREVMAAARALIEKENPALLPNFVRNCGFSVGIGYREGKFVLNDRNTRLLREGMVFNVCVGFSNLVADEENEEAKSRIFALQLADTVIVRADEPKVVTNNPFKYEDVSYSLEEQSRAADRPVKSQIIAEQAEKMSRTRLREREVDTMKKSEEEKIREHQKMLALKIQEENLKKYKDGVDTVTKKADTTSPKDIETYKSTSDFPTDMRSVYQIYIDQENEAVLLPIYGKLVPFHIKTIKNVTKNDNMLRINFLHPGNLSSAPLQFGFIAQADDLAQSFVREVTYVIGDQRALGNTYRLIQDLKKRVTVRDKEAREKKTLVRQERLIVDRTARVPKLSNVMIRPPITKGKMTGNFEAHRNGLRFVAKGYQVDILYKNIKHAFFQQAKKEVIVVLHFHLENEIMVGKKKTKDVQVCAQVMEASERLDNPKKRWGGDVDEIEEEQRQRRLLNKLNDNFNRFAQSVEHITDSELEFDIPFRELGFMGVHYRANVLLQPTVHCLVNLIDIPFFVLPLADIAIVHLERVKFRLRNFDMVIVFSDFSKAPAKISQIPTENLDRIKQWLNSCNIKFYQGPINLQWPRIMKTIAEDPADFFQSGGWSFLEPEEEEEDEMDDQDEEFEADEEDYDEEDEDEYDDDDDEYSDEEEEDYDEEEDEGEDWEELERKARSADKKRMKKKGRYSDDELSD